MKKHLEKITSITWEDLPLEVKIQAKSCLKDIVAAYAGSLLLPVSAQAEALVSSQFQAGNVPLWFRGKRMSLTGAAFFNSMAIDSCDCHDGFRPNMGHAGATVVPVVVGACAGKEVSGKELLTSVVMGYEIACRAGLAVHKFYTPIYHSSGAWAALGACAGGARIAGIDKDSIDNVLGIAEYYAPISPLLRCTNSPGSVKDGAAAGALAAALALEMHAHGMYGLPSIFSAEEVGHKQIVSLGDDWIILRQYFKPYPTCRWTHPVVEGVLHLQREYGITYKDIERIEIETFDAAANMVKFPPKHTDAAQYSMPWVVAAVLVDGELGIEQIHPKRFSEKAIIELGYRIKTKIADDIQKRFPEECLARVTIFTKDNRKLSAPTMGARGDYTSPLSKEELDKKFDGLVEESLGKKMCCRISDAIESLDKNPASSFLDLLQSKQLVPSFIS
jgi:2-methylcitrate dehydratase PrpD